MAIYKISDLLSTLQSSQHDGYEYVDLSLIEADEDSDESLVLNYIVDSLEGSEDFVDSVELPPSYSIIDKTDN
jgi:hypothetical protein